MKGEILVFRLTQYRYNRKETGEIVEGGEITFTTTGASQSRGNNKARGIDVITGRAPYELFNTMGEMPGWYEADLEPEVVQDRFGNEVMSFRVQGIRFLRGISFAGDPAKNGTAPVGTLEARAAR